jgi:alkanesulfonate monooxygenase SsuD/methylene tetrahydromethanopterin reductase-like flavin-dependent oxidoreductase (luciferase family)
LQPWGTPDEVSEQIRDIVRRTDAGGLIVVSAFGNLAPDVAVANQERFARVVMPALSETVGQFSLRGIGT